MAANRKPLGVKQSVPSEEIKPATPSVVKRKQITHKFFSPTDSIMSPCSQKLIGQNQLAHPAFIKQKAKPKLLYQAYRGAAAEKYQKQGKSDDDAKENET